MPRFIVPTAVLPEQEQESSKGSNATPGELLAGRWRIEDKLGAGAMGAVYRAVDETSGDRVAVKILHHSVGTRRFAREAAVLADLSHPGIVRYVAHGTTEHGQPYLTMELLVGDTLSDHLFGKPLPLVPTVALVRRVAEALGLAHASGVIHRDIKPSNLFLEDGDLGRVKILDFGIARPMHDPDGLTQTGSMVGTPGYMAPEQVRGSRSVDARADVFALGCVLYECLTGEPAFYAHDVLALLSRILFDEPRPVRDVAPLVSTALANLCERMLAKDPEKRPPGGRAVAEALAALEQEDAAKTAIDVLAPAVPAGLGESELRILTVVVATRALEARAALRTPAEPSRAEQEVPDTGEVAEISTGPVTSDEDDPALAALRKAAEPFGARVEGLMDGSVVATIAERGAATDRAAQAARCALALRRLLPQAPMSLATGRGEVEARLPMGEAIDRAAILARAARILRPRPGTMLPIRVDSVTAGLLDARFELGGDGAAVLLLGERETVDATRTLLGKPTPFVGRDTELAALRDAFERCVAERAPRAVLVTGAAGTGKSRLAHELVRSLRKPSEPPPSRQLPGVGGPEVWLARGDPMRQGSPFGLLAQTVRRAAALVDGEPLFVRQHKLRARVDRVVGKAEGQRVAEFLGELIGAPFGDDGSVQLRAARKDPILMGDQMRRAWEDWVRAECERWPVVVVLEDLQWGDLPTVEVIDHALRNLRHSALLVLALARPEIREVFPSLWSERRALEIALADLAPAAAAQLASDVLGPDVHPTTLSWLVEHSQGNALYLEELIRAVAEGKAGSFPGTLLAVVQARLEALPQETRRVLRAASVFGDVFCEGGVRALLGGPVDQAPAELEPSLSDLAERELITRRSVTKLPGEREYSFRAALVQEAAYESLTDEDRRLGHRLAAEWLEQSGESEAVLMAKHFERAREPGRAARWYARAAEQALEGNDLPAVIERAERAIDCGAGAELLGSLRLLQAEAHRWQGDTGETARCAQEAMEVLAKGTPRWFAAAAEMAIASSRLGRHDHVRSIANALDEALLRADVSRELMLAAAQMVIHLIAVGRAERAERIHERLEAAARRASTSDPAVASRLETVRGWQAAHVGNSEEHLLHLERSIELLEQTGDVRSLCREHTNLGFACCELGLYEDAEQPLRHAMATADRMGLGSVTAVAKQNLATALARQGKLAEARTLVEEALAVFRAQGNRRMEGAAGIALAGILKIAEEPDAAERAAREAAAAAPAPPDRCQALGALADVLLSRRKFAEALAAAREATDLLKSLGGLDEGEALVRLVYAKSLAANGLLDEAKQAAGAARERLRERAATMRDPRHKKSFLEKVPDNARTLELAHAWLGDD